LQHSPAKHIARLSVACGLTAFLAVVAGCAHPLSNPGSAALRREVERSARLNARGESPAWGDYVPQAAHELPNAAQLDETSGPERYADVQLTPGAGLHDDPPEVVYLSLGHALRSAAARNLDAQVARLLPQVTRTEVVEAQAAFDPSLFARTVWREIDEPRQATAILGSTVGVDATVQDNLEVEAGLRKRIQLGGTLFVSTGFGYVDDKTPNLFATPDPAWTGNVTVGFEQPLLRNFGTLVNTAQIVLAQNAERRDILELQRRLIETVSETEVAYWELVFARYEVAIRDELLRQATATRDDLENRRGVDANPVQRAQANSIVAQHETALLRRHAALMDASDRIKRLMNDPQLPLLAEQALYPLDHPGETQPPGELLNAVLLAINERPEPEQALSEIDDADLRREVAKQNLLPELTANGQLRFIGQDGDLDQAFGRIDDDGHVDYEVAVELEMPLGNREAEAVYKRTRLARQAQVLRYRSSVQDVSLEVKQAMRQMHTAYREFQIARQARRAAAENLRALNEREKAGERLTPEFLLDLKLRTQERVAEAETTELRAAVDYNIARARFDAATGLILRVRGIDLVDKP